ncbi:DUF3883 domain-containing protein [Solwaraspora sp. WMMD792]|uniref:DUF3883 domain-containing protein n=1 Tax=Solwaraspora sp. WMMD792 TaxID=3016099 RepID=UPI002415E567|nr:DUF3883 domain-containing protein [Solwaraspora sp. WMMD792]MDG4772704.1 DUF3883 domain-containing protein [Solwaraspora sp. WMMD792]
MTDDDGRVLNAEFVVELDGPAFALLLESAGGRGGLAPSRNSDYTTALELLLARLRSRGAVLVDALVDSKRTAHLPETERRLLDGPVSLAAVDDLAALRLQLTSRQGRIGQPPGAPKAGNNRKRLRLRLHVPGYSPGEVHRLSADLAAGSSVSLASGRSSAVPPQSRGSVERGTVRLNEWWRTDPAECYWLEITNRDDLGANVQALQRDGSGRENWSYALVTALRPGDVVLHWHQTQRQVPGIVGYSFAADGPFEDELVWHARGSYGQARPTVGRPQPSWRYELADYTALPTPVDQVAFQRAEAALREIRARLEAAYSGPLYFPFAFSDSRPVRVMQAYLVKFPAVILDAVPELAAIPRRRVPQVEPIPAGGPGKRRSRRASGSGYVADPLLRRALERHAVRRAGALYKGWTVEDVGDRESYDLRATKDGEEVHVEVKGSSGLADTVELTRNEVRHAHGAVTHLVVVDQIEWARRPSGEITTAGGRVRRWVAWTPMDEDLEPTRYRYKLSDSGAELMT